MIAPLHRPSFVFFVASFGLCLFVSPIPAAGRPRPQQDQVSTVQSQRLNDLAAQIARHADGPLAAPVGLRRDVRALPIREAAQLGEILLEQHVAPAPWLRLSHERERAATENLHKLQRRFGSPEAGYESLETTVRGSARLRAACGDELLTEVTGVGFWSFADGIAVPTTFNDADVEVVLRLPGIERVTADSSQLTDRGVVRLASLPRLRELRVGGADIGDESLQRLSQHRRLRVLDVAEARRVTDAGVRSLDGSRELRILNLRGTSVTSASLDVISRFRQLEELSLSDTQVCEDLSQLRALTRLRELGLAGLGRVNRPVPTDELRFLSGCRNLHTLRLHGTAVSALDLRDMPQLSTLRLGHTLLTDLALIDLPRVSTLNIAASWGEPPLVLRRLRLQGLRSVGWLHVQTLTPEAANGLASGMASMPGIRALYLSGATTSALAAAIGRLEDLRNLSLKQTDAEHEHLAAISAAPKLEFVTISGDALTSRTLSALSGAKTLYRLQVEDTRLNDAKFLATLTALTTLRLDRCTIRELSVGAASNFEVLDARSSNFQHVRFEMAPLVRASLSRCRIRSLTFTACPQFAQAFCSDGTVVEQMSLTHLPQFGRLTFQEGATPGQLELMALPRLTRVGLAASELQHLEVLKTLPALQALDLAETRYTDEATKIIAALPGLRDLRASPEFRADGLRTLTALRSLQELQLYRTSRSDWTEQEVSHLFAHVDDVSVFRRE